MSENAWEAGINSENLIYGKFYEKFAMSERACYSRGTTSRILLQPDTLEGSSSPRRTAAVDRTCAVKLQRLRIVYCKTNPLCT